MAELLTAEGLNDDGFFNAIGTKVDAIMVVLEGQISTGEDDMASSPAPPYQELLAAE